MTSTNATTINHNHGTDLWGASNCSADCLQAARNAKQELDANLLEASKNDKNIGGGYALRGSR